MARKLAMSWVAAQRRWTKGYKGKTYSVSAKQLGAPETKEQIWMHANLWWEARQAEIDAQGKQPATLRPLSDELVKALSEHAGRPLNHDQAEEHFASIDPEQQPLSITRAANPYLAGIVDAVAEGIPLAPTSPVSEERTVGGQADRWLMFLKMSRMDVATLRYYRYSVGRFRKWIGDTARIETITAPKLEEFYFYLSRSITESKVAQSTAAETLNCAKQFCYRLVELGLIPLPGNLRSRRLTFAQTAKRISTFTNDEVKLALGAATGRPKLYLLLMLNCGMYQADISDLGDDEVDWKEGVILRERSKRRGRADAQLVPYKLWPETWELLREHRTKTKVLNESGSPRVLLTSKGRPLCDRWEGAAVKGGMRSYDTIVSAWNVIRRRTGLTKSLRIFRKTSATKLAEHPTYKFYCGYFLAHSPKSVAERHYVKPNQVEFYAALEWLRAQWL